MIDTAEAVLRKFKPLVWKEIDKYLDQPPYPRQFNIPQANKSDRDFHWRLVREYPQRQGKYLRPILVLLSGLSMGANIGKLLKTATAMQLSEEWLLIHDDIEDGSLHRRGKPTLHRQYNPELAINAGDTIHVIMWKVLLDNQKTLGSTLANKISQEFYTILSRTTLGQTVEINWAKSNYLDFDENGWFVVCDGKTSYYTIAGPLRLGAIIAGASQKQLDQITDYGMYLGRCFQIMDDILDLTSDFAGLKKQMANDIYEGKRSLILGHVFRHSSPAEKVRLTAIMAKDRTKKTAVEVKWVLSLIREKGSIEAARQIAIKNKVQAEEIFKSRLKFMSRQPHRQYLEILADFILNRDH